MTGLVIATRSPHKMREIRDLLADLPLIRLLDLDQAGIPETSAEESIEAFDTFEQNALAKARYFARLVDMPVLADDSGLCVDALGGAPGVRSKRFAGRPDLAGLDLDLANNAKLIESLRDVPTERRTAHYACAIAIVDRQGGEEVFRGTVEGVLLAEPRGAGGFGYDPLFFASDLGATFAEIAQSEKNRLSHRARAAEAAIRYLRTRLESSAAASLDGLADR